jgi:hypothetical protein
MDRNILNEEPAISFEKIASIEDINLLTEEEVLFGLRKLVAAKRAAINERKYIEKISAPVQIPQYTPETLRERFMIRYQETTGKPFQVSEWNTEIIDLLCEYFTNDEKFTERGYDLDKNILLGGPTGCGKTTIMNTFARNTKQSFLLISAPMVANQYEKEGSSAIEIYSSFIRVNSFQDAYGQKEYGYFIDDFGDEDPKQSYGNNTEVIREIVSEHYRKGTWRHMIHMTTNLNNEKLMDRYGKRFESRLNEMFNFIPFPQGSQDMRKVNN